MKKIDIKRKTTCKVCGKLLPFRHRRYCSKKCRNKEYNRRYYDYRLNRAKEKRGEYASNKKRCLICGKWYIQVGTHIAQSHQMTAREYREDFNLPVKRGILSKKYRKLKGERTIQNKTFLNLKKGKRFWFKKGDPRTKKMIFWKSHRYQPDEYYE